jgi:competence protein ComEA
MLKKILAGVLIVSTVSLFGMSIKELNKADKEELMQIKGVGDAKADAIIKERKKGHFKSFEDVTRVKGIGEAIANNIKHDVKVKSPEKSDKKKSSKKKKETKKK